MSKDVEFTQLAPNVYVAGQLEVKDIARMGPLGVSTLVCNRPDGEADQTESAAMSAAAEAAGIRFVYLPMSNPEDTVEQRIEFKAVLAEKGVVLAYCRSGRRSSKLWEASTQ